MTKRWYTLFTTCIVMLATVACSNASSNDLPTQETASPTASSSIEPTQEATKELPITADLPGRVISTIDDLNFPLGEAVPFPQYFTGNSYLLPLTSTDEVFHLPGMTNVTFEPCARTHWHSHDGGQILMVTGGVGYHQIEGEAIHFLREGDIVKIEPGVRHWHGASPDSWFSHIAISTNPENASVNWQEAVEDSFYNEVKAEEFPGRTDIEDQDDANEFLFAKGSPLNMETFNGTNYVAPLIQTDDIFNMPGMMNVIFEPGVINNWHNHAGGQVMIATDGIGFHQLKGQPVEVLYPGDVAFCPPNEDHWHGAAPDSWFAHIAITTNPELRGMEWLEPLTEEEYNKALEALETSGED